MSSIFQGIFWIICNYDLNDYPNTKTFDLLHFKVLCDINGVILDHNIQLNSKSGKSFNHKIQWSQLPKKIVKDHSYQYYPRGRVEIRNRKAIIFLNPIINKLNIIDKVKEEFCLNNKEIYIIELTLQRLKQVGFLITQTSKYTRKHIGLICFIKTFTTNHSYQ